MPDKIYTFDEIKQIVVPIAARYDVDRVFLIGSYARGEANAASDLDFVIDKGRLEGLRFLSMLGDLTEDFGKEVDLITSHSLLQGDDHMMFRQDVVKEGVLVYEQ